MFSNVSDVVEAWIADRKLSRRNLAFLRTVFQQMTEWNCFPPYRDYQVADGLCCEELDLPRGSSWLEVIASLLDHLDPRPSTPCRLEEVMELLEKHESDPS